MSNMIELGNDLQKEFSTRARTESRNHYILPWTRGWQRRASSLDPIYKQLGINNFTRQDYINLRTAMPQAKRTLYQNTLTWLIDNVMNGDYTQDGNSCGAWSTIHWEMRNAQRYYTGLYFRTKAMTLYNNIKFALADWVGPVHPTFQGWVNAQYVNPWKILNRLKVPRLQITQAAYNFQARNRTAFEQMLHGMLTIINHIKPPAKQVVQAGNLTNLREGEKAIIIAYTIPAYALHYMLLVKTKTDWHIYNSNSAKLNPTVLAACPQFSGTPIVTNLLNRDGTAAGTQTHQFIGVFIKL